MKRTILITLVSIFMITGLSGQEVAASDVFMKLSMLSDQFNDKFDPEQTDDKLTIIYIPGTNNPVEKIYSKSKAGKIIGNVLLVGGFKEMMKSFSYQAKKSHLQEALSTLYPKGSKVIIDMESELGEMLALKGYAIVTISKKQNKIINNKDYGFDRVEFFKALSIYEEKS